MYCDFIELARSNNIDLQPIRQSPPISEGVFGALIAEADGFLITFQDAVSHEPFRQQIAAEVRKGKRLLVPVPDPDLNPMLLEFDLAITSERVLDPDALFGDERTLLVRRTDQIDPVSEIFLENCELTVSGPRRVWYGSNANPLFIAPQGAELLNKLDRFEIPGPRLLCCGGIWTAHDNPDAQVMVLAGSALRDPFTGSTGKFLPGLRANIPFAERLLQWWVGALVIERPPGEAITLLHKIEVGLYDVMRQILQRVFPESSEAWWYRGIPADLRKRAAEIHEESNGAIPKEHAFYFIWLKRVLEENWQSVQPYLDPQKQGKKQTLGWLAALNDLRN